MSNANDDKNISTLIVDGKVPINTFLSQMIFVTFNRLKSNVPIKILTVHIYLK